MRQSPIQICDKTIYPGESLSLALPLPELFSCAPMYMPVKVFHGKQAGPCMLITAAMHGNELNGTEIIHQLLNLKSIKRLKGTLIAVPVMNVYGLINRSRLLPGGINLDTCFPGSKSGTHAARMAHIFTTQIYDMADICIDLQTGFINYTNLPQVYVPFKDQESKKLAEIFNAPVISNTICEKGMLRTLASKQEKPFLTYQAGGAMQFDDHAIKVGIKGILNVMRYAGMLADKTKKTPELKSFLTEKNIWISASTSGISHSKIKLGQHIKKGELLSIIKDPFGGADNVTVNSPGEGVIVGKNNLPLVHEGEKLFQLAVFPKMRHAATYLEEWKTKSQKGFEEKPNQ